MNTIKRQRSCLTMLNRLREAELSLRHIGLLRSPRLCHLGLQVRVAHPQLSIVAASSRRYPSPTAESSGGVRVIYLLTNYLQYYVLRLPS